MEIKTIVSQCGQAIWAKTVPFTSKRDLNGGLLLKSAGAIIVITVLILLFLPTPKPIEDAGFKAKPEAPAPQQPPGGSYGGIDGSRQGNFSRPGAPGSDVLSGLSGAQAGTSRGSTRNLNSAMILSRQGTDAKTQLPPGSRFRVRITQLVVAGAESLPVIGELNEDVYQDSDVALPNGSRLLGDVAFDEETERARMTWKAVIFPDGRQRDLVAMGMGADGQLGIEGKVHSEALKNAIGQTLGRFIGAYAEGTMTRNTNGYSLGGGENGLMNAVGQTAKDRAQGWADNLKKERRWIEIPAGQVALAVLSQPFTFRDPGGVH